MKTAAYYRYSSTAQRAESIEGQRRICTDYALRQSITIDYEYVDEAKSATNDKRPSFQRMIRDAERGKFSTLIVYSIDRFARNQYDNAIYKNRLQKAGVRILYATQDFGESPESIILYSVLSGYAEYYSRNLAVQVKRGMTENALKGRWNGAAPLGYQKDPSMRLIPDPITAPYIRYLFERYASGDSIADIIRALNAQGARTAQGNLFTRNSFSQVIHNRVYIGEYKWDGVTAEGAVPPIIEKELFERVQEMSASKAKAPAHAKAKEEYILSGKLFCGICGAPMIGESGKSHTGTVYHYYTCANRKRKNKAERCTKKPEKKTALEAAILNHTLSALTDDSIEEIASAAYSAMLNQSQSSDRLPALKEQLRALDTRINNLLTAMEAGIITPSTKQRLSDLEAEKEALCTQIAQEQETKPILTKDEIAFYLYKVRKGDMSDPACRFTLLNTFLNSAVISDRGEEKEMALIFNLKTNATLNLKGSDLIDEVHRCKSYPNPVFISNYHLLFHHCLFV